MTSKRFNSKWIILFIFSTIIFSTSLLTAQRNNFWNEMDESVLLKSSPDREIIPLKYLTYSLELDKLQAVLATAPERFSINAKTKNILIALPMPDGSFEQFKIFDAHVMPDDLAARYPGIHSYSGVGINDPTATVRFDVTLFGFHALIFSTKYGSVYIDPYAKGDQDNYLVYAKKDIAPDDSFVFDCGVEEMEDLSKIDMNTAPENFQGDCSFRSFRMALACTGEFSQYHGGTVDSTMSALTTILTRANGILEREVSVTLIFVSNNDQLVFLDGATDPYSNFDKYAMLGENTTTCNGVIGQSNYDIGHAFSLANVGGVASLSSICGSSKARGISGTTQPLGNYFFTTIMHELGHQFGGHHTQNNDCNRNSSTAMETGSGSTIISYGGVCSPNVVSARDEYYHAISLQQMGSTITNSCGTIVSTNNNPPIVDAGSDRWLPISTPFQLTSTASDPDGDPLTYCWEQMDNTPAVAPPISTSTVGPAFRSFPPTDNPTRYFPRLFDLIGDYGYFWEELPSVERSMKFRVTVRDNNIGYGCTAEDDLNLNFVENIGPFVVTYPSDYTFWMVNETKTITWDVANTNFTPVNCGSVNILLSTDGGWTYPTVLATGVGNSGSADIVVPDLVGHLNRVKVEAANNIFYDISNVDFSIVKPYFSISSDLIYQDVCGASGSVNYDLNLESFIGFDEMVSLSVTGLPPNASADFTPNNITPPGTTQLNISGLENSPGGGYPLTIVGTALTNSDTLGVYLIVDDSIPDVIQLWFPEDEKINVEQSTYLTWAYSSDAASYIYELATNPGFGGAIIETNEMFVNSIFLENLNPLTVYYWRVKAENPCGEGEYSDIFSFQTNSLFCSTYDSPNVPLNIDPLSVNTIVSELPISEGFEIAEIKLNVDVSHTYIGDLDIYFRSVDIGGPGIPLLDRPGVPNTFYGCPEDNLKIQFDDNGLRTSQQLENTCSSSGMYAIEGVFQPIEPLSTFVGENSNQVWELSITDWFNLDGGVLNSWSLELCEDIPAGQVALQNNQTLLLLNGATKTINNTHLSANSNSNNSDQIIFMVLENTQYGNLQLNGMTLGMGATFTQQDIENGAVAYSHFNLNQEVDEFEFSIETADGGWSTSHPFNIEITLNDLSASAVLENDIDCHNQNNGKIVVTADGSFSPFQYSLDGMTFQNSPVFDNLSEGTYVITVMDNFGFTAQTNSIIITNPPILLVTATVSNSDLTASGSGGTGSLEYSLDGVNFQSSPEFLGLSNGIYEVTVRDANGCTATATAQILVNSLIVQALLVNDITCHNFNDGTIIVTVTGGIPPFQYSLDGMVFQNNNTFTNLSAGSYVVTVLDSDGFTQQSNFVNITNPPVLSLSVTVLEYDLTASGSGGTGSLEYSLDGMNFQSNPEFLGLSNGNYEVTVRDANGCTTTATAQIAVNSLVVQASLENDITCHNFNDGTIIVAVTGGTPPFQYSLDGMVFQNNNTFTNLSAGSYVITVLDSEGFTQETNSVDVTNPPALSLSVTVSEYDLTASGSGGTGSLEYSLDGMNFQSSPEFLNLTNGNYEITVRDANGCTAMTTAQIAVDSLVVQASLGNDITCHDFNDGTITVAVSGGTPPLQYSLDGIVFQNNNTFTNLSAGSYLITVLDSEGFTQQTNSVDVTNPAVLSLSATVSDSDLTASGSGGTGSLEYSLDGMNFQSSPEFLGLSNGTYEVTVRDANGCTTTATAQIAVNSLVVQASLENDITCHNFNDGTIIVAVTGGTPPFQYSLDGTVFQNNNTFTDLSAGSYMIIVLDSEGFTQQTNSVDVTNPVALSLTATVLEYDLTASGSGGTGILEYSLDGMNFQTSPEFLNLANGNYEVTVRDAIGCTTTTTAQVAVNSLVVLASLGNDITCHDLNDGTIIVAASGGEPPLQYSLDGIVFQNNNTFTDLSAGSYLITVVDSEGLTQQTNSVDVTNPTALSLSTTISDADLTISGSGGTGILEYSLDGVNFQSSPEFLGLANGTYEITVRDANGCMAITTAQVAVNSLVVQAFLDNEVSCFDGNDGQIIVTASGGTAPIEYSLDGVNFQDSNTFLNLSAGSYTVTVKDADGFIQLTNSIVFSNPDAIIVSTTVDENNVTIIASGGTGDLEYSLDGINFQSSNIFPSLSNGSYNFTVKDENGCLETTVLEINLIINATTSINDVSCFGFSDGSISITQVEGGTPTYQYSLDGVIFQVENFFDGLAPNDYQVWIMDATGDVFQTILISIVEPMELIISTMVNENNITINGSGGIGDFTYSINGVDFQTANLFEDLPNEEYTVWVMDENGCLDSTTILIDFTSTNELDFSLKFDLYPNPNQGKMILSFQQPTQENLNIKIFDVSGKLVLDNDLRKEHNSFMMNIDVEYLSSGTYYLLLTDGYLLGRKRFIKMNR